MEKSWKVLLIDDDPAIRKITGIALQNSGYSVLTAPDGKTGLEICREESPQIIITDVGMPGMDGLEVLKKIKEMDPDKEVIVSTAFTEIGLAIKAMQLDATGFVTKPVSYELLLTALKRAKERYARRKQMMDYTSLMEERWMDTAEELGRTFLFQKMLIEGSIDGIAACNSRGRVIIFNPSMEKMLGYPKAEVLGKMSLMQFFAPGEAGKFQDELYSEGSGGEYRLFPFETRLLCRDGTQIPVMLSATVLFQEEEQMGIVVFFRKLDRD